MVHLPWQGISISHNHRSCLTLILHRHNGDQEGVATVVLTKSESDSDVMFCLQLLSKTFIDVPRPLTNDLWVFLFQSIDAGCVK